MKTIKISITNLINKVWEISTRQTTKLWKKWRKMQTNREANAGYFKIKQGKAAVLPKITYRIHTCLTQDTFYCMWGISNLMQRTYNNQNNNKRGKQCMRWLSVLFDEAYLEATLRQCAVTLRKTHSYCRNLKRRGTLAISPSVYLTSALR